MSTSPLPQEEIRKHRYIIALQGKRFTIIVGSNEDSFKISRDLLSQSSPVFKAMCFSSFMESVDRVIRLPEVDLTTFQQYFVWLHSPEPQIDSSSDIDSLVHLGIFAEIYQINHLKNQTTDALVKVFENGQLKITPTNMSSVYSSASANSVIRNLFSLAFAIGWNNKKTEPQECKKSKKWARKHLSKLETGRVEGVPTIDGVDFRAWLPVFEQFSDLGCDYFRHTQQDLSPTEIRGGSCKYHDHSDIPGWKTAHETPAETREGISDKAPEEILEPARCSYPYGAPVTMPEKREFPKNNQQEKQTPSSKVERRWSS
ncbi:hypothetical protein FQN57_003640 [Myotisia sp. PD_48]|nr:hypothetical protein FQN57_003640 [Myotisia sp. PD_48]